MRSEEMAKADREFHDNIIRGDREFNERVVQSRLEWDSFGYGVGMIDRFRDLYFDLARFGKGIRSGKVYDKLKSSDEGREVFDAWKKFININKGYRGKSYQEVIGCILALDRNKWEKYWTLGDSADVPCGVL